MIRDLSLTLQAILDDATLATDFPELLAAQVAFDRPSDPYNPSQSTVDLFLFDIRENMELRSSEPTAVRTTAVKGHFTLRKAPMRVACSYLVTAWPKGPGDQTLQEHRLLSQALQAFSQYPHIPATFLKGKLVGQEPPLPMLAAQADGVREPHEFWAAIGNKMRPSFIVTVTLAMNVFPAATVPEVVASRIRMDEPSAASHGPVRFRFGGRVTDAANAAVADADVKLPQVGLASRTDGDGRYQIGAVGAGTYTLQVTKGAKSKSVNVTLPPKTPSDYDVKL